MEDASHELIGSGGVCTVTMATAALPELAEQVAAAPRATAALPELAGQVGFSFLKGKNSERRRGRAEKRREGSAEPFEFSLNNIIALAVGGLKERCGPDNTPCLPLADASLATPMLKPDAEEKTVETWGKRF